MSSSAPRVQTLPSELIDQIAAGEVVERPSSVVKELVENALDAGAQNVAVDLTDGGLTAIVVTDDGRGMDETDLRQAVMRHATSKLRALSDLDAIATYGFRGEALSSIGSVSRLTLSSRLAGASAGRRLRVTGGRLLDVSPIGCPSGTSVAVESLFYNTPARQKFLRAAATEQAHVHESLLKTALGRRAGGFVLTAGQRTLLDVPPHAPAHERPGLAFGRRQRRLTPFAALPGDICVSGFLAPPSGSRRDGSSVWAFVNGRPVRDRMLQRAAVAGYQTAYPDAMGTMLVYVDLESSDIDVNVHPQKLEVRFSNAQAVYETVARAVAIGAATHAERREPRPPQRAFGLTAAAAAIPAARISGPAGAAQAAVPRPAGHRAPPMRVPTPPRAAADAALPLAPTSLWQRLRPLAHAPRGALCCEGPERSLVLLRLRAARAAIAEARWQLHASPNAGLPNESLLLPPSFAPTGALAIKTETLVTWLTTPAGRQLGVALEPIGPQRFAVCRLPTLWPGADPLAVLRALVACHDDRAGKPSLDSPEEMRRWIKRWSLAIADAGGFPEDGEQPTTAWASALLAQLASLAIPAGPSVLHVIESIEGTHKDDSKDPCA